MIKPSELLKAYNGSKVIFYGTEPLKDVYTQKLSDGGYSELDLSTIDYSQFMINSHLYNYSKAIQSACYHNVPAEFIAAVLDKFTKVKMFEFNEILYVLVETK